MSKSRIWEVRLLSICATAEVAICLTVFEKKTFSLLGNFYMMPRFRTILLKSQFCNSKLLPFTFRIRLCFINKIIPFFNCNNLKQLL